MIIILYPVAVLYQPAREQERALMLRKLPSPGTAILVTEAVTLRGWMFVGGMVPPDPYILVTPL